MTVAALVPTWRSQLTVQRGLFRPEGFDWTFEKHAHQYTRVQSLTQAARKSSRLLERRRGDRVEDRG
jgi:hypothetical protein